MRLIQLTKFYAQRVAAPGQDGKPILVNAERIATMQVMSSSVINTKEQLSTPVNDRPVEAYTLVDFETGAEDGGYIQVKETPEEIITLTEDFRVIDPALPISQFRYKNHRGETATRQVIVDSFEFNTTPGYGYSAGWFLSGYDLDKKARRSFAVINIVANLDRPIYSISIRNKAPWAKKD